MKLGFLLSKSRRKRARRTRNLQRQRCARRLTFQSLESRQLLTGIPLFESGVTLPISPISSTETSGEKPQSKVWEHDDQWWAVIPDDSGTWLWQLEQQFWNPVLQLSSRTDIQADVKPLGDLAHILLFGGTSSELVTLEYNAADPAGYQPWTPNPVPVTLSSGVETATLDIDSAQRMWIASDAGSTVNVRYSDFPYVSFSSPITVGSGITSDDIAAVTSLPGGQIGVLWSDQNAERFVYSYHVDGAAPNDWSPVEYAAEQSALSTGNGMADDHLNVAVASDGTLYAAVKTSYDSSSTPSIALLVRQPSGDWDSLYHVDTYGTRPIVVLNEDQGRVLVAYTEVTGGGDIVYRESDMDTIQFGARTTVMEGNLNDVSSTRGAFGEELVFLASKGDTVHGAWLSSIAPPPPPPPPPTTTITLRDGVDGYQGARDTKIKAEDPTTNYGYDAYLETDGSPQEATLLGWDVSAMQPGTVVQSASITMYVTNRSDEEYGLFQLLQDWREDEATWEQYSDSGSWQSEGILGSADAEFQSMADFTPESLGSITVDLNAAGVATIQSWIDNPSTNRGMLVQGYDARNGAAFSSRETGDVDRRPQLSITFEDDDTPPIDPANLAPVVDAGEDQTVTEGTNVWLVADVEDDGIPSSIVAVQWSVVSGPGSVVFSGENSLQTAASISTPGTYVLELTADDGQLTSSDTVTIEVLAQPPVNLAPTVDAGASQTITVGDAAQLQATVDDDGLPNSTLGVQWTVVSGPGPVVFANANSSTTTASMTSVGTYVLELTADDSQLTSSDTVTIEVLEQSVDPINLAPTVDAGASLTITVGDAAQLQAIVDDDGLPISTLEVQWTVVSGPGPVVFANANSSITTASMTTAGTYVLELTADDSQLTSSDTVTIEVFAQPSVNLAPNVEAGASQTITVADTAQLQATVNDDGLPGPTVAITWSQLSGPGTTTFSSHDVADPTAWFSTDGTYVLQVVADDGELQASDQLTIVVEPESITPQTIDVVGHWALDETGGSTAIDDSGLGNDGQLQGNPTRVVGPDGNALRLDGRDDFVLVPHDSSLEISDSITLATWIRPETKASQTFLSKAEKRDTDGFEVSLSSKGTVFVRFNRESADNDYRLDTESTYPTDGDTWMHVAATYDGATIRIYVDGQLEGSLDAQFEIATNNLPLGIGAQHDGSREMKGSVDNVQIHARALSASEITQLMEGGTPTDPPIDPPPVEPTNEAPSVDAGADHTIFVSGTVQLDADIQDDGLPSGTVTSLWTKTTGPGTASFDDPTAVDTAVSFNLPGTYVLRLSATDSELQDSDEVTIQVQEDPDPIDSLVGEWLLNESNGSTALDSSGQGNHGAIFGDAAWIDGVRGSALQVDGADDRVIVQDDSSLDVQDSVTISAWLRPEQQETQYVISKATKAEVDGFELSLSGKGTVFVRFNQDSEDNQFRLDSESQYPTDGNTWIHVAATYDGNTIRMYINGQLETSSEADFQIGTNNLNLSLGAQHDGYRAFTGGLDGVSLFNRALSDNEVLSLYQS